MQNFGKSKTEGERQAIGNRGQIVGLSRGLKTKEQICADVGCTRKKLPED